MIIRENDEEGLGKKKEEIMVMNGNIKFRARNGYDDIIHHQTIDTKKDSGGGGGGEGEDNNNDNMNSITEKMADIVCDGGGNNIEEDDVVSVTGDDEGEGEEFSTTTLRIVPVSAFDAEDEDGKGGVDDEGEDVIPCTRDLLTMSGMHLALPCSYEEPIQGFQDYRRSFRKYTPTDVGHPVISFPNTSTNLRGTTCLLMVDKKGKIVMGSDGYGLDEKTYDVFEDGELLRIDWLEDVTADFRPGSAAWKYYHSLLDSLIDEYKLTDIEIEAVDWSWNIRKEFVVLQEDNEKIFDFKKTNKIVCCFAGFFGIFDKIRKELLDKGEDLTLEDCVVTSLRILKASKSTDFEDYKGTHGDDITGTSVMFGTYVNTSEGMKPRLVYVDKDGPETIEKSKSIGFGSKLADKTLEGYFKEDIGDDVSVVRALEALEAASVMRMSGGVLKVVTLNELDEYTECGGRIGC